MAALKEKDRKGWRAYIRYVDWQGVNQIHTKRGFRTKKEAIEYEREFLLMKARDINMGFEQFVKVYLADVKPQIKYNTYLTKEHNIKTHILPYFANKTLASITATDIIQWQNEMLSSRDKNDKPYAQTYLRTVQNQLNAIMNHAHRYYGLVDNPVTKVKKMGKAKAKEMLFWTKEEYLKFADVMKSKPISYYAFEVLYWTGIREGELLALTRGDIDIENRKLTINKSFQKLKGEDYVTDPKTEKSNRIIDLPEFLCDELEDYFGMIYKCKEDTRLFTFSKSYLHHEMDRGSKVAGVKRIRVHDLRHSHVAHLIELGFSPVEIAERMGHEGISVTYTYSHLYPSKQKTMADKLNQDRREAE
ncbi:MAG: site-specific integrase [Lachnospiraceae bacterium]|nr:site-specific integrase [Lachnospiraceae bacterium]